MNKFIAVIMAGNCENTIRMCIRAVLPQVDKVIICYDTSSKDSTEEIIQYNYGNDEKCKIIHREYEHDNNIKNANSNQRNYYLNFLKKNYIGDWCIVLDADEIVDDNLINIKDRFKELEEQNILLLSPRMVHFQQSLGQEDVTKDKHYVLHRLFKITEELLYPDGEHPVLQSTRNCLSGYTDMFIIYHMAYCREMFYIKNRYLNHQAKSEMHTPKFLQDWYYAHLTGSYPSRKLDVTKLPKIIKEEFMIDDDFWYFKDRNLEMKHIIDAAHWRDYFKPETVFLIGDGKAIRTFACNTVGLNAHGMDISEYAVENNIGGYSINKYFVADITNDYYSSEVPADSSDLVVVYDVLEHIDEKDILKTLKNCYNICKKDLIISVPMIGDPNLMNDDTHKIFWTREQWENKIKEAGFIIESTPEHFQYRQQLIIARKK